MPATEVNVIYAHGRASATSPEHDPADPRRLIHYAPEIESSEDAMTLALALLNEQTLTNPDSETTRERERQTQERIDSTPPVVIPPREPRPGEDDPPDEAAKDAEDTNLPG